MSKDSIVGGSFKDQSKNVQDLEREVGMTLEEIRNKLNQEEDRVREVGKWPPYIERGILVKRAPAPGETNAQGFDAGMAAALDLIPRDKQELADKLHAAYTKESILKVLKETQDFDPDSETSWWLAACKVCEEGGIDEAKFLEQIKKFKELAKDEKKRKEAAEQEYQHMKDAVSLREDGVPFGEKDGCIQGAYLAGYTFGTQFNPNYGLYFIGTYEDSLGLEGFQWESGVDEKGQTTSGPVRGSKQFVKCANKDEFERALAVVRQHLPLKQTVERTARE